MATTRLMPLHASGDRTIAAALGGTVDYVENPDKTNLGDLVTAYECDPLVAQQEFMFAKSRYTATTGRDQGAKNVIAYHLRQSFKPGEVTPEQANKIGYELAMSLTKAKYAFLVCTHVDKAHIHSHIVFNSTSLDCTKKFRNFHNSSFAIRRISDKLCIENGLSFIANPKPSKGHYGKWQAENRPTLLIDIQAKLDEGKSAGYEHWATLFNIKQMSQTIIYLQNNNLLNREKLGAKADEICTEYHQLANKMKSADQAIKDIAALKKHVIHYTKYREIYGQYRKAKRPEIFFEQHRMELTLYQSATKYFDQKGLKKLPSIKSLQDQYAEQLSIQKDIRPQYQKGKKEMQDIFTARANIDQFLSDRNPSHQRKSPHR